MGLELGFATPTTAAYGSVTVTVDSSLRHLRTHKIFLRDGASELCPRQATIPTDIGDLRSLWTMVAGNASIRRPDSRALIGKPTCRYQGQNKDVRIAFRF